MDGCDACVGPETYIGEFPIEKEASQTENSFLSTLNQSRLKASSLPLFPQLSLKKFRHKRGSYVLSRGVQNARPALWLSIYIRHVEER